MRVSCVGRTVRGEEVFLGGWWWGLLDLKTRQQGEEQERDGPKDNGEHRGHDRECCDHVDRGGSGDKDALHDELGDIFPQGMQKPEEEESPPAM